MPGYYVNPGATWITNKTSVAIGPSGKPIRVFDALLVSTLTASTVKLFNSADATGGFIQLDGVINKAQTLPISSANGILFPLGCFASVDNNTTSFVVSWDLEA